MGWTPRQVGEASLWEFAAAWKGWRKFNTAPDKARAPSDAQHEAAVAWSLANPAPTTIH